jgi:hypothetical protein
MVPIHCGRDMSMTLAVCFLQMKYLNLQAKHINEWAKFGRLLHDKFLLKERRFQVLMLQLLFSILNNGKVL